MNHPMMRSVTISLLFSFAVLACSKKIAPDSKNNTETKQSAAKEQQDVAQKTEEPVDNPDAEKTKPPTSDASPLPPSLPPPSAPKSPEKAAEEDMGKTVYTSKCNKCHAAKKVNNYTLVQWESILKTMVPNAKLSGDEEMVLLTYIRANAK
jgi:cytochrome c5